MGIFQKLKDLMQEKNIQEIVENVEKGVIYSPLRGKVIALEEVEDDVFSQGMLGKGCGIRPSDGNLYAPFNGEVLLVASTKHSIALQSEDGIEFLIHVGMDTVKMDGKGFYPKVKIGDKVRCGQLLMTFSIADIKAAGYVTTTAFLVTNSDQYDNVELLKENSVEKSDKIMKVS